jgi:hypothetical protein
VEIREFGIGDEVLAKRYEGSYTKLWGSNLA